MDSLWIRVGFKGTCRALSVVLNYCDQSPTIFYKEILVSNQANFIVFVWVLFWADKLGIS